MDLGGGEVEYDQNALHEILKEFIKKKKRKAGNRSTFNSSTRGQRTEGRWPRAVYFYALKIKMVSSRRAKVSKG